MTRLSPLAGPASGPLTFAEPTPHPGTTKVETA